MDYWARESSLNKSIDDGSKDVAEPKRLSRASPLGKASPNLLAMKPETPQRATLPKPPPIKINSAFHITIPTPPRRVALVGVISTETVQAVLSHREKANPIAQNRLD
jgi:hypothetical protein